MDTPELNGKLSAFLLIATTYVHLSVLHPINLCVVCVVFVLFV